jgi:hypothetical protein
MKMKEKDLAKFETAIATARAMAAEDASKLRDEGTCVLGAGIVVYAVPARCRNEKRIRLIGAPFQGNVASHKACERALAYLKEQGLPALWYDGVMD